MDSAGAGGSIFSLSIFFLREIREPGDGSKESRRDVNSRRSVTRATELSAGSVAIAKHRFRTGTRDGKTRRIATSERHWSSGRRFRLAGLADSIAAGKRILFARR